MLPPQLIIQVYTCIRLPESTWVFPKIRVPPNHPFVHRLFHEINHPFWGVFSPYFWVDIHMKKNRNQILKKKMVLSSFWIDQIPLFSRVFLLLLLFFVIWAIYYKSLT